MKKRLLSALLALCLLLSMIPTAFAEDAPWQVTYADYSQTYIVKGTALNLMTYRNDAEKLRAMLKFVYSVKLTGNETAEQLSQKGIDLLLSDTDPVSMDVDYGSYSMREPCEVVVDTKSLPVGTYLVVLAISEYNAPGTFWANTVVGVGLHVVNTAVPLKSFEVYACDPDGSNRTKVDKLTPEVQYFNVKPVPANATNVEFPTMFAGYRMDANNMEEGLCWGQLLQWDESLPNGVFKPVYYHCGNGILRFDTQHGAEINTKIPVVSAHIPGDEMISETKATCTAPGSRTFRCTTCDEVVTEEIKANGHSWADGYIDSINMEGKTVVAVFTCDVCGETEYETISISDLDCPFRDVPQNAWYRNYVVMAYQLGLINGTSETTFDPNGVTTRAMVVRILFNMAGDEDFSGNYGFSDVPQGRWFTQAINWAAVNGYVNGVGNNRFEPNAPMTREQVATILYRFAESYGFDVSGRANLSGYRDQGQISKFAKDAVSWAVANGLMNGTSPTTLAPKGQSTRAQIATIMVRFLEWADEQ